jgi:replicative DNA helicase
VSSHLTRIAADQRLAINHGGARCARRSSKIDKLASEDAERSVLGFLIENPGGIEELAAEIDPSLFFYPTSHVIFHALVEMYDRREPIGSLTISQYLERKGDLDKVGGVADVLQITSSSCKAPGVECARYELEILRELATKREVWGFSQEMLKECENPGCDILEVLSRAEERFDKLRACHIPREPLVEFKTPSEIKSYIPPEGLVLTGDHHIVRGSISIIAGPPGVGKSRATVALAPAGATATKWFGLAVPRRFKTMILQAENGMSRLQKELADVDSEELHDWFRISPPPKAGLCFERPEFRTELNREIAKFRPDLVVIDPWNAIARDEKARDYRETFDAIREIIPAGDGSPALLIVAHTRKPRNDERPSGRALLHEIAGSYILTSIARSAFIMQHASNDPEESRIVWNCSKNSDGKLGARSVWARHNGLFEEVTDFDWNTFDLQGKKSRSDDFWTKHIRAVLEESGELSKAQLRSGLIERTGRKDTQVYEAIKRCECEGHLMSRQGKLTWKG